MVLPFANEPFTKFSEPGNAEAFRTALAVVRGSFGTHYPLVIGGERVTTARKHASSNPSRPDEIVGTVSYAGKAEAEAAVNAALAAYESWSRFPAQARAQVALRAAAELRRRKHELSATMVYEVGKSWAEADGDTAEAIDFCDFYGREMLRLAGSRELTRISGEANDFFYIPLGVGVVIPPWNFPLAILTGMTVAAMVTGNTVVLKPASDTPVIGAKLVEVLESVGCPPGVVNFLPGPGGEVGDTLVTHPKVRFISFTGSMEVGLRINELAAKASPGQIWIKRVIAEMGGKDSILVDETADLEAAAKAIVASAYGFQGQKCSACSRAIVVEQVYDKVLARVVELAAAVKVGNPEDPSTFMGPLSSEGHLKKVLSYVDIGKSEGRLCTGGAALPGPGHFMSPAVVADVAPDARLAQEEVFGPVLAFLKAKSFKDGLAIANNTRFGLTGAVFSRSRERLEEARRELHVGNLYLNRKCTGALVDVHPFGGFNMSGTDSKAGGRDYLLLFLQGKSVAEAL
ncbi:MAG: L-glutamate gamma-semialdehyde dehydrogenase [Acidobacteriota bacterium]